LLYIIAYHVIWGNEFIKYCDTYKDAIDWLKFLTGSNLRIRILLSLNEGVKDLKCLKSDTGATSSTILHAIGKMVDKNQLIKGKDGYYLTHLGKIQAVLLIDIINSFGTLYTHKEFWLDHNVQGIPEPLIKQIGYLSDSTVVRATTTNPLKPFSSLIKALSDAKEVKGVFPIFHKDLIETGEKLLEGGVNIWLVITEEVFDTLRDEYKDRLKNMLQKENFKLWVIDEDVKEFFTITDSSILFSLFSNRGVFDLSSQLVSHSDEAILWGYELFEYYRKRAKIVKMEDV